MAEQTANPATALLTLLDQWNVPAGNTGFHNQPATGSRVRNVGDDQAESVLAWRQQATAVRLVVEIDGQLRALRDDGKAVDQYLARVPKWYQAAFAYTTEWNQPAPNTVLARGDRDMLEVLIPFLDETTLVGALADTDIGRIRGAIREAEDVIRSSPDLPAPLRRYILGLFSEAGDALDDVEASRPGGQVNLRRATTQLHGLLNQAADEMPGSSLLGAKLRELARQIGGLVAGVAVGIAINAGSGIAQNAIDGPPAATHVTVELPPGANSPADQPPADH